MNYKKQYDQLISRAMNRVKPDGYTERHHINPKSFGGSNDATNIATLTAREHFIAHLLLARMFPNSGMVHAAFKMACALKANARVKISSRTYQTLRAAHAYRVANDKAARLKKSASSKGKKQTSEHILARTEARKNNGKEWHSDEAKKQIRKGQNAITLRNLENQKKRGNDRSEQQKAGAIKSGISRKGRTMLPEQIAKSVETRALRGTKSSYIFTEERLKALKEEKSKVFKCPHCDKCGALMIMKRWHFDNCKLKKEAT